MRNDDKRFITEVLMPRFDIKRLLISHSNSAKKWPDIWIEMGGIPIITVTREWAKQNTHERRKRLVHEFLHLTGLDHGKIDGLDYNTEPRKDTYSRVIYDLIRGQ